MATEQKNEPEFKELRPSPTTKPSQDEIARHRQITDTVIANHINPQQKRILALEKSIVKLSTQITETEALLAEVQKTYFHAFPDGPPPDPAVIVKRHIDLLHEYNEVKDVGTGLLAIVAESKGVRFADVRKEFGVDPSD